MKTVADMILPVECVDEDGWVDLSLLTGQSWKTVSASLREVGEGYTRVESFNFVVGDPACDPRSGGVAGAAHLCQFYGVGEQQFKRHIAPKLSYLRWFAQHPVTNVASAQADGQRHQRAVASTHCSNLKQFVPNSYYLG